MTDWRDDAACRGSDPELWCMPVVHSSSRTHGRQTLARIARAKAICATCPSIDACRDWYEEHPDFWMIAAAETPNERRLRSQRRTA